MAVDIGGALDGFTSLVELVYRFIVLVVGEVAAAIAYSIGGRRAGQRARERAHLLTSCLLLVCVGGFAIYGWMTSVAYRRIDRTERLVAEQCVELAADLNDGGRPVDPPLALQACDAWGNPVRAYIERGNLTDSVFVESSGPDGLFGSNDDIRSEERVIVVRQALQEMAVEKVRGLLDRDR